jgi:hypothetical protein
MTHNACVWAKKLIIIPVVLSFIASPVRASSETRSLPDYSSAQWSLRIADMESVWREATGYGVTIAVIDTGVDASHPDLLGSVLPGYDVSIRGKFVKHQNVSDSIDHEGHGTSVAGVITANRDGVGITGVAPDAMILPIAIDDSDVSVSTQIGQIVTAIELAASSGVDFVNISLGTYGELESQDKGSICGAIYSARLKGVLTFVASGNNGDAGNELVTPGSCPHAVSIGSVDSTLNVSSFSSFDPEIDFTAPGEYIVTTSARYKGELYEESSGTSFSAPYAAGIAALVLEKDPTATPDEVLDSMKRAAVDKGPVGDDVFYGSGVLDASLSVGLNMSLKDTAHVSLLPPSMYSPDTVSIVPSKNAAFTKYKVLVKSARNVETREFGGHEVRFKIPEGFDGSLEIFGVNGDAVTTGFPLSLGVPADVLSVEIAKVRLSRSRDGRAVVKWSADIKNTSDKGYFLVTLVDRSGAVSAYDTGSLAKRVGIQKRSAVMRFKRFWQYDMYAEVSWVSREYGVINTAFSKVTRATAGAALDFAVRAGDTKSVVQGHINKSQRDSVCSKRCGGQTVKITSYGRLISITVLMNDGTFISVVPARNGRTVPIVATIGSKKKTNSGAAVSLKLDD